MRIEGSCHCSNIAFAMDWTEFSAALKGRSCGCDFCRMHGATWTSHPEVEVRATIKSADEIIKYQFGHKTAEFYICARCGIVPFAKYDSENGPVAVVNINTFDSIDRDDIECGDTDFDDETVDTRLARRSRNWSPLCIT